MARRALLRRCRLRCMTARRDVEPWRPTHRGDGRRARVVQHHSADRARLKPCAAMMWCGRRLGSLGAGKGTAAAAPSPQSVRVDVEALPSNPATRGRCRCSMPWASAPYAVVYDGRHPDLSAPRADPAEIRPSSERDDVTHFCTAPVALDTAPRPRLRPPGQHLHALTVHQPRRHESTPSTPDRRVGWPWQLLRVGGRAKA